MAYILRRSRMLHIPRTGGKWFIKAAFDSGVRSALYWPKHSTLIDSGGEGLFTFAFVRNPLDWYRSYFAFNTSIGRWGSKHWPFRKFESKCMAKNFRMFIDNVLEKRRGFYSDLVKLYIMKSDGSEIDFIGRTENLAEDSIRAMSLAGEIFDPSLFLSSPKLNAASYKKVASYDPSQSAEVKKADSFVFRRFYSDTIAAEDGGTGVSTEKVPRKNSS